MKKYFFILFFLPFSMISQNRDYVIFEGKKYKGKLLQYSNKDISFENLEYLLFFDKKKQDTIKISSELIYKLKIKKPNQFFEFDKKSWNNIEMGFNFDSWAVPHGELFFSKGIVNDKYLDPGLGLGIFTVDLINFFPIYLTASYDILPTNKNDKEVSMFRVFSFTNIGYSIGTDIGNDDYISTSGGFYFNPGIGIKKSSGTKHLSLRFGYLLQRYKSEHNFWWWDQIFIDSPFGSNFDDNIIRRNGSFRRMTITFGITF